MKKFVMFITILLLTASLIADWSEGKDFLLAAIDVNDNTTAVEGTDFDSEVIPIGNIVNGLITVVFTPAAAAGVNIEFHWQVSNDNVSD